MRPPLRHQNADEVERDRATRRPGPGTWRVNGSTTRPVT